MAPVQFVFVFPFLVVLVLVNPNSARSDQDHLLQSASSNTYHFSSPSASTRAAESRQLTATQFRYYDDDPGTPSTFNSYNRSKMPPAPIAPPAPPGWPAKPWFYRGPDRSKPRPASGYGQGQGQRTPRAYTPQPQDNSERSSLYKHDSPVLRYADGAPVPAHTSYYRQPRPQSEAYSKPKTPPVPAPGLYTPTPPPTTIQHFHNFHNTYKNQYVNQQQQQQSLYMVLPPPPQPATRAYAPPPTLARYAEYTPGPAPAPPTPQLQPQTYAQAAPSLSPASSYSSLVPSHQPQFVVHNQEPIATAYGDALGSYSSSAVVTQLDKSGSYGQFAVEPQHAPEGEEARYAEEASFPQQYVIPVLPARTAPSYPSYPSGGEYYTHNTYASPYKHVHIEYFKHLITPATKSYDVEFKSGNGIHQQEHGYVKTIPRYSAGYGYSAPPRLANVKTGSVSWTSPEGIPFTMSYIADENGFRPVGPHIPGQGQGPSSSSSSYSAGAYEAYASTNYETLSLPPEPELESHDSFIISAIN